jgi:hypothetical protein
MILNFERDVEGSGRELFKIVPQNLPGEAEENHENLGQDSRVPGRDLEREPQWNLSRKTEERHDKLQSVLCNPTEFRSRYLSIVHHFRALFEFFT